MDDFAKSYLGRLRKIVGHRTILMPGARCVIEDRDGRILMQLRSDFHVWGLPAGFCEEGESTLTTLIREVEEETGLRIDDPVPWGHTSDPRETTLTYPNGDVIQAFGLDFVARSWTGSLRADGEETLALDWFSPGALPDEMIDSHRTALRHYARYRETGDFQLF